MPPCLCRARSLCQAVARTCIFLCSEGVRPVRLTATDITKMTTSSACKLRTVTVLIPLVL